MKILSWVLIGISLILIIIGVVQFVRTNVFNILVIYVFLGAILFFLAFYLMTGIRKY